MKRIISLGLLVSVVASFFLLLPSIAKKHGGKTSSVSSVTATITGNVTFLAKRKGFPTDLAELYAGNDSSITLGKKGKKINVTGTYTGGSTVTVNEKTGTEAESDTYSFDIPVIRSILETFSSTPNKDFSKSEVLTARFGDISKTVSIIKVVTSRQGNTGTVTGTFAKQSAQGRFTLNFSFE